MWYAAKQTIAPQAQPITVEQVKSHVYVDFSDDDAQIGLLIGAAVDHVERYCNIRLATQTVEVKCDGFDDFFYLPFGPVQSITSVKYIDVSGAEQTLDSSFYELRNDDLLASLMLQNGKVWPARQIKSRITVTAVIGYDAVPPAIKHALLLLIASGFQNREAQEAISFSTADALLCNFRHGA